MQEKTQPGDPKESREKVHEEIKQAGKAETEAAELAGETKETTDDDEA